VSAPPAGEAPGVPADRLRDFAIAILEAAGLPAADARIVADSLVDADLRGIHSHGVSRLGIYVQRLDAGGNRAQGPVTVVADAPSLAVLDGGDLLSQVPSARAVALAVEKARETGCAAVSVRGAAHFGAAGYWARLIAEQGLLGMASTNTSPLMAPWGGVTTAIGTNPLAMAFPSSGQAPVVMDVATSETTWGAVVNASAAGAPIPDTWALGRDGAVTTSASEAVAARRLLPFGRHKGYAIAVGVELLTGALAGARCLSQVADMYGEPEAPMGAGLFFLALDPGRLSPAAGQAFADAVRDAQRELNGLPPAAGVERVLWPGQPEAERAARRRAHGIPLPAPIAEDVRRVAAGLGVAEDRGPWAGAEGSAA
jgi:LDH2 family malate/lactate/ureidoglycolate dehydrogenase